MNERVIVIDICGCGYHRVVELMQEVSLVATEKTTSIVELFQSASNTV